MPLESDLTDGRLFASGHHGPPLDTFEWFASRAMLSCPLSSGVYALTILVSALLDQGQADTGCECLAARY